MRFSRTSIGLALRLFGLALLSSAQIPASAQTPPSQSSTAPAAVAYSVLEKHCARCHQAGQLTRTSPAAGFGNILRLDELAAAPHLVQPGNPDASRLYLMMMQRQMPIDAIGHLAAPDKDTKSSASGATNAPNGPSNDVGRAELPTGAEIAAIRAWISSLPPRKACPDRKPVTLEDHAAALATVARTAIGSVAATPLARLRFLSIAHLHNACASAESLAVYRQAIVRAVNSLSWKSDPIAVVPVDPAATLFRVSLDDLGWLPEHWERIMRSGPHALGLTPQQPAPSLAPFGSNIPIARADWFAETVLSAPLYYDVLGLPAQASDIYQLLQVGGDENQTADDPIREAVSPSAFSHQPSLVERQVAKTGAFWRAYHGATPVIDGSTSTSTASPTATMGQAPSDPAPNTAIRTSFTLPNGLPAFLIVGPDGDRMDAVPPLVSSPTVAGHSLIRGGQDCLSCHGGGPVLGNPAGGPPSLSARIDADRRSVAAAIQRLGLDPALSLDGVDPVRALARSYTRPLDAARAAAELFIPVEALAALADKDGEPASILARRLMQGTVQRAEIERFGHHLVTALGRPEPGSAGTVEPGPTTAAPLLDPSSGVILFSDKVRYRKGDALHLTVRATVACQLTLVSVDTKGRGTVIFPSDFQADPQLAPGQELKLPGPDAPYSFRLNEIGRETVIAVCNRGDGAADGIRHDFERQRFTDLGDYATYLARNATIDPNPIVQPAAPPQPTRRRGRRRPPPPEVVEPTARPQSISRTAISITVDEPIPRAD